MDQIIYEQEMVGIKLILDVSGINVILDVSGIIEFMLLWQFKAYIWSQGEKFPSYTMFTRRI